VPPDYPDIFAGQGKWSVYELDFGTDEKSNRLAGKLEGKTVIVHGELCVVSPTFGNSLAPQRWVKVSSLRLAK
jgi:hypothetical protein